MDANNDATVAIRGRWAVAAIFFMNGLVLGSWAPQIPVLLMRLEITEFTLGLLILLFGAGAVSAMVLAGHLIARHGSKSITTLFAISCCFGLLMVALAPDCRDGRGRHVLFGGTIGATDVSMNANAVTVEKRLGRAIMSSSHGFWSLGGFVGGSIGGIIIRELGTPCTCGDRDDRGRDRSRPWRSVTWLPTRRSRSSTESSPCRASPASMSSA